MCWSMVWGLSVCRSKVFGIGKFDIIHSGSVIQALYFYSFVGIQCVCIFL